MAKYLVNAIDLRTGDKIPMGLAENEQDLENMKKFANTMNLNHVYEYEVIKNPDEEDLNPVIEMGQQIVSHVKTRNMYMDLGEIYKEYDNGELSDYEAIQRIQNLFANRDPEEMGEAIKGLYAPREHYENYDDPYEDDDDKSSKINILLS